MTVGSEARAGGTYQFAVFMILGLAVGPMAGGASGQDFTRSREWTDVSGRFKTDAALVKIEDDSVKLRRADGREVSLPTGRLSETDRDFIGAVRILQQSAQQYDSLSEYLHTDDLHLAATVAVLQSAARSEPDGLVAPFFLVVAKPLLSRESSAQDQAQRASRQVIDLIERVQEYWPNLHRQTLASTYTNLAVISARKRSESGFVNYLRSSAKASAPMISFATHHNVSVALSDKTISASFRNDLSAVLTGRTPQPGPEGPPRLAYALEHDTFEISTGGSNDRTPPSESKQTQAGHELLSSGSAFLIAPDLALTNRHVAEEVTSFVVRNDQGFETSATTLVVSSDPRVDLAVLQLEKPSPASISPLPISPADAQVQAEMILLGYPRPSIFEHTLTTSRGSISKYVDDGCAFIHEAAADPGSSGGPCINRSGAVVGVVYAQTTISRDTRNYAVSPTAIRRFLTGANIEFADPASDSAPNFADVVEATKAAVLYVEAYGPPSESQNTSAGESRDGPLVLYDDCCLMCGGSGVAKCRRCINGFLEQPYIEVVGRDVAGNPITGQKFAKKKCPHCDNGGRFRCPLCGGSGDAK